MGLHIGTPRQVRDNMTRRIKYILDLMYVFFIIIEMINNVII
jgi:hypothetical protein